MVARRSGKTMAAASRSAIGRVKKRRRGKRRV